MAVSEGKGDLTKIRFDQSRYGLLHRRLHSHPRLALLKPQFFAIMTRSNRQITTRFQSPPFPALVEGVPVSEPMPVCGIGIGWALFLSGFFIAAIPWYVGAFLLLFVALDYREKPGLVACTVAVLRMGGITFFTIFLFLSWFLIMLKIFHAVLALIPVILNAFRL